MRLLISTALAMAVLLPTAWAAGNSDSARALTRATILPPIRVTKIQDLWFGEIILHDADMVVDTLIDQKAAEDGGTRSADQPSFMTVTRKYQRWHNARFEVTGHKDMAFTFVIPQPVVVLRNTTGATAKLCLDQNRFNSYLGGTALDAEGKSTIWVGGRLTLSGQQIPGLYSGDFEVCVAYY